MATYWVDFDASVKIEAKDEEEAQLIFYNQFYDKIRSIGAQYIEAHTIEEVEEE